MKNKFKKNKKIFLLAGIFLFLFILTFSLNSVFVSSQSTSTYCAEKTKGGLWCQDVPQDQVDPSFQSAQTSCESTSFCKLGTCINSKEGRCLPNVAQRTCQEDGGVWDSKEKKNLPQCTLGCCLLGDQAAFVTQTECNQLSSDYGLNISYRTDIKTELSCIATAVSDEKGSCVYEKDFQRTCKFTTHADCNQIGSTEEGVEFHPDFLCSSEELATNCGPSERTTLSEGKDEVYFADTCGNLANIYDSSKADDVIYWEKIIDKKDSCGYSDGNAGSASCGNCDYFLGSTGKIYDRAIDPVKPNFGDYICRDLGCAYDGKQYKHGETWCSSDLSTDKNQPGEKYSRLVCYNGEVTKEPCNDFRQEVCVQNKVNDFSSAACRPNRWQSCVAQDDEDSCKDSDVRDCKWIQGERFDKDTSKPQDEQGSCVPLYGPGYDFWNPETDAQSLCAVGDDQCIVKYEKGLIGGWKVVSGGECLDKTWGENKNKICVALGDCGVAENFLGKPGSNKIDDLIEVVEH